MQTIRITTSQNIDIDYEIAGLGERIVARLIDFGIFILILISFTITGAITAFRDSSIIMIIIIIIVCLLFVFYDLLCEVFMNGQSIGKRVMKIKVISLEGGRPSFGQYLLRWLFRIVDFALTFGGCALITAAVSEKCQRVGDIVAGTTLIKTNSRSQIDSLAFYPVAEGYTPVFNEASQLKDRDIILIHEVIAAYIKSGNTVIIYNTAAQLKKVLAINSHSEMNDLLFLQTLVKDYNHIVAGAEAV
jgi:uncharacterized RDD family membrane protein YckC